MKTQNIKARDFENRAMSGLKVFAGRVLSLVLILSLLFNSIAVDGEAMPRLRFVRAEGVLEARLDEMEVALGGDEDDDAQEHVYSYVFSGAQTRLSDVLRALALSIDTRALTLDAIGLGGTGEDTGDDSLAIPNDPIAVRPTDGGDFIITPLRPFDEARITIDTPAAACVIRLETLPDTVWDIPMETPTDEVEYQLIHDPSETEYEPQWTLPPEMEAETEAADAIESEAIEPFMDEATDPELLTEPELDPDPEQDPDSEPDPEPQSAIVVTITGHSLKVLHDGEEHSVEGYDVSISDPSYTEADFTFTGAASAEGTDVGKTAMGLSAEMFENINSDFTDVTFDVTDGFLIVAQELTITAGSASRAYNGVPLTEQTYTAEGLLDGHSVASVTITGEQTDVGTSENVPSEARIVVDEDDADVTELYEIAYVSGTLTVEQAVVTVSPDDMSKVYGDEDPVLTATVTGLAEGESLEVLSFTLTRAPGQDVTEYDITVTGETEQGNYLVVYDEDPATFTIKPALVTVTAVNTAKVYGERDPERFEVTVSGLKFNDAPSLIAYTIERDEGEDVGTYDITPDGHQNQGNYEVQYIEGTFTITPARAVVTAKAATKVYGEDDPEYEAGVTGLVGEDDESLIDYDFIRAPGEDVGEYALTPIGAEVQGNYAVEYVGAMLTITRASAIVRPEALEKVYGEVDPELTIEVEGLQNDDEASVVTCEVIRAEGENVGTYTITATGEAEQGNYNLTYAPGVFTITRATVTVTPDGIEKTYGSADPTLTASVDGLLNEDDEITYTVTREEGENVGNYVLTATGAAQQGNYQVSFETGEFTIAQRPITVSVIGNSAMSVYDGQPHRISGYELEITDDSETPLMDDKYIYKQEYVTFEGSAITDPLTDVGEEYMGLNEGQFANTNDNYAVVFAVSDGIQYVSHRTVQVRIIGNHAEFNYDSASHSVEGYTATIEDEVDNALYNKANIVNNGEAVATRAESGRTGMGLSAGQFANVDPNFDVNFTVVDGYIDILPIEITVSITGNRGSYVYDGEAHTVKGYVASSESVTLFDPENVVFTGVDEVSLVDAGEAPMGLHEADFAYDDPNVKATFQIIDGSVTITPIAAIVVTIEGNHDTLLYDGEAHTVIGYTATADTPLYDVDTDIALTGEASATRDTVGTSYMGLQASQFSNTNPNFESVVFTIGADGYMTISPNSATVTITGNRVTAAYNGQPQSITGFTARADTPLYDVDGEDRDFTFSGAATATRTDAVPPP